MQRRPIWPRPGTSSVDFSLRLTTTACSHNPDTVETANSVVSVEDFVNKHSSFKTLGPRHCFNRIADSTQQLLTTDFAAQAPAIDSAARTISVGPGIRYGTIAPLLEAKGF